MKQVIQSKDSFLFFFADFGGKSNVLILDRAYMKELEPIYPILLFFLISATIF